jgi:tetratricopeptide (TPR) repeat protein
VYAAQSVEYARKSGVKKVIAHNLRCLAQCQRELQDFDTSDRCIEESVVISRAIDDLYNLQSGLNNLMLMRVKQGKRGQSLLFAQEAFKISRRINSPSTRYFFTTHLALWANEQSLWEDCTWLLGYAQAHPYAKVANDIERYFGAILPVLQQKLTQGRFLKIHQDGQNSTLEEMEARVSLLLYPNKQQKQYDTLPLL